MKKLYILLAMVLVTSFTFAQRGTVKGVDLNNKHINISKTPTDTICIDDFFNVGQPSIYGDYYGYTFGTSWDSAGNPQSPEIAQGFLMTFTGGYNIEEVLIWTGAKDKSSSGSSIDVKITKIDGTSSYGPGGAGTYSIDCPKTVLGSATVLWDDIDTVDFTIAPFTTPVYVTTDYAVTVNFDNFYTNGDTIGIVCSEQGGGSAINGIEYTWWKYRPSSGNPFWVELSHIFSVSGSPIDVCYAVFPVVDMSSANITDNYYVFGMKMTTYPNPARNEATLAYELENNSDNVVVTIVNERGRLVRTIEQGAQNKGSYTLNLDLSDLASGNYFCNLSSNGQRLIKRMVIVK